MLLNRIILLIKQMIRFWFASSLKYFSEAISDRNVGSVGLDRFRPKRSDGARIWYHYLPYQTSRSTTQAVRGFLEE